MSTTPQAGTTTEAAPTEFDFNADFFDSRDVIARIDYLVGEWENNTENNFYDYGLSTDDYQVGGLTEDEAEELRDLLALQEEAASYVADWPYGETFIADDYFQDYARELADDISGTREDQWPFTHIDWEAAAEALKQDYAEFTLRGTTYWAR